MANRDLMCQGTVLTHVGKILESVAVYAEDLSYS